MGTHAWLIVQACVIIPMATRIVPDHPPLTQARSSGEKRQLAFALQAHSRWSPGDIGNFPEKLPTTGKPQEEHRQRDHQIMS
ncbi:MAG TPA: hypothetical protein VFB02_25075 [Bradyrhizobium sp.]|nr:hypothetical protein [Bradyrhizobium sp.]